MLCLMYSAIKSPQTHTNVNKVYAVHVLQCLLLLDYYHLGLKNGILSRENDAGDGFET